MNKKEISEIRRRFAADKNSITRIRGCYIGDNSEIISTFDKAFALIPESEAEEYYAIFKGALSGKPGENLLDIAFTASQVTDSGEHKLLSTLRSSALRDDEAVSRFYAAAIESLDIEGDCLILLVHDVCDVKSGGSDALPSDGFSDVGTFGYILCAVCPVKQAKASLSYQNDERDFRSVRPGRAVSRPELGFMFPAFEERAANINGALYYTRDAADVSPDFAAAIFGAEAPQPVAEQKAVFASALEETLGKECSFEVVQAVRERVRELEEENAAEKSGEPVEISKNDIKSALESCGVSEESVAAFAERYDAEFGSASSLPPRSVAAEKRLEIRTPEVEVRVNSERSDLVETRVIDGIRYILVRADGGAEVNGVNIVIKGE